MGYAGNLFFGVLLILIMFKIRDLAQGLAKIQENYRSFILQDRILSESLTKKILLYVAW